VRQEGVDWILELKAFLISGKLPEKESEAERILRQATGYYCRRGETTYAMGWLRWGPN
jgi:hypothetical protein